jgi:hypothetical protein
MTRFNQFLGSLAQVLVTFVHLEKPGFMLSEHNIQFIHRLGGTRSNCDETLRIFQWPDWNLILLLPYLIGEESNSSCHFVDAPNFANV